LLVLEAAALPFVWAVNESAALVLLFDSAATVVVGAKVNDCAATEIGKAKSTEARKNRAECFKVNSRWKE
jgi:TATA-box binding protein (TBP) (component of TFIID and TFIIIB)